jgi:hypothetical protein
MRSESSSPSLLGADSVPLVCTYAQTTEYHPNSVSPRQRQNYESIGAKNLLASLLRVVTIAPTEVGESSIPLQGPSRTRTKVFIATLCDSNYFQASMLGAKSSAPATLHKSFHRSVNSFAHDNGQIQSDPMTVEVSGPFRPESFESAHG